VIEAPWVGVERGDDFLRALLTPGLRILAAHVVHSLHHFSDQHVQLGVDFAFELAVLHDVAHLNFDLAGKRTVAGAGLLAGAQGELVRPGWMLVRRRLRGNGMRVDEQRPETCGGGAHDGKDSH
jgi:hypothetical protein